MLETSETFLPSSIKSISKPALSMRRPAEKRIIIDEGVAEVDNIIHPGTLNPPQNYWIYT